MAAAWPLPLSPGSLPSNSKVPWRQCPPTRARRFFTKYPSRILFGTDNDPVFGMYSAHVRQLETEDEWFWPADAEWWRGYGMGLPRETLVRIYSENADELLRPRPGN